MSNLASLKQQLTAINSHQDIAALKQLVQDSEQWLADNFITQDTRALVHQRAEFIDALLQHCWGLFNLDGTAEIALIAVGGYGREQLHPQSDVDLLFLYESDIAKSTEDRLKKLITALWDIKLDIGHSVRSVEETFKQARQDITIATNLLESRLLAGCNATFQKLKKGMQGKKFWSSQDYYLAKMKEQNDRHAKFHGTAYNLEPNLKENPGCLRDIQTTTWVAKKHFNVLKGHELVDNGYLKGDEFHELLECRDFIWQMRFALHIHTNRNENRLLFDHQPAVAKLLGYGEGKKAVETMMKAFFRTVRRIIELNEMLLQHFDNEILLANKRVSTTKIDDDYCLQKNLIKAKHNDVFNEPEKLLEFFFIIAETPAVEGIHSNTLRLLRSARRKYQGTYLNGFDACRDMFMRLVRHPLFFGKAWDLMHKHGVMQAYMAQWDHIVGLMQFDMFHAYTVDEHTHRLIKNIYNYTQKIGEQEFPRCSRIMRYADKPELLYLAAIFHDISKGKGGDHSELGELEVLMFARQHNLSREDGDMVAWLVRNHLMMSVLAQRRDIHDPDVIRAFGEQVVTEEKLSFLFALTSADIRATNDSLWNNWKASLLRDTFLYTKDFLKNEGTVNYQAKVDAYQTEAMAQLLEQGFSQQQVECLWANFDDHYFVRNRPAHIVWHTSSILALASDDDAPLVSYNTEIYRGCTAILIYSKDKVGLFAQIASTIDNKGYSIHDAQIMCTSDNYALDTIIVADGKGHAITSENTLKSLSKTLEKQLLSDTPVKVKRRTSRQIKQFSVPTKVTFLPAKNNLTIMDISALDTPGLIARIANIFAKASIHLHSAKVSTIGERAEDFFIISNEHYLPLDESEQTTLKASLIAELNDHNKQNTR